MFLKKYFNEIAKTLSKENWDGSKFSINQMRNLLNNLIKVNIQKQYDEVYDESGNDVGTFSSYIDKLKAIPCITPPWKSAWFEYRNFRNMDVGAIVIRMSDPAIVNRHFNKIIDKDEEDKKADAIPHGSIQIILVVREVGTIWDTKIGPQKVATGGCITIFTDDLGKQTISSVTMSDNGINTAPGKERDEFIDTLGILVIPIISALGILNCKNKIITTNSKTKKKRKRNKPSIVNVFEYVTVDVEELSFMTHNIPNEDADGTSSKKRVLIPGRYRDYRKGKGLFGRWKGIYYFKEHWKGDARSGTIIKDYKL